MIPPKLVPVLQRYRSRGVVLDSNLLVLLVVGAADPELISQARPTRNRGFAKADFQLLLEMLARVGHLVVTPHILAETSNLLDQVKGRQRDDVFATFVERLKFIQERFVAAVEVVDLACFAELGLTDCAIVQATSGEHLTITVDAPLYRELLRRERDAINFDHFRPSLH